MTQGKFITLEGGEGAGKSTQAALLTDGLIAAGITAVATREPGGSPGAEDIRKLLVEGDVGRWNATTEALLHTAARVDHVETVIRPALESGTWVICDRFADSTIAYQGYGLGLGRDLIAGLQVLVLGNFTPDLTLILDIEVEDGLERAKVKAGGEDRYERMDQGFHARLRKGFLEIAQTEPDRCAVVPADGTIDAVQAAIRAAVSRRLKVDFP